ncbi:MAG: hypothetical protein GPJ52_03865 [Candidatus Heimdallarchaeota archaeon]|nr:hypothetical protein [Candidatus Heimdallarchaeota archaeon]
MVLAVEDFLKIIYASDLKYIANRLDIEYEDGILKPELIDLIIANYFPNGELTKRKLKKILDMLYKEDLVRICKKLFLSGYSRFNKTELRDYLVEECFNFEYFDEDEEYKEEHYESDEEIDDYIEYEGDDNTWSVDEFLDIFTKNNLMQILDYYDFEYKSRLNKNDLKEIITDRIFPNYSLNKNCIQLILDAFYKYELDDIFYYSIPDSFSGLNTAELHRLIVDFFTSSKDEISEDIEEVDDCLESSRLTLQSRKIKILMIGAQPDDQDEIELNRELLKMEAILDSLDVFKLIPRFNQTFDKFIRNLKYFEPNIVHLTAHGDKGVIVFEDDSSRSDPKRVDLIAKIINRYNKNRPVDPLIGFILSSCNSLHNANELTKSVHFVLAMSDDILVDSAMQFLEGFYREIKLGSSIQDAYDTGLDTIDNKSQRKIPKLLPEDRDFSKIKLVTFK